MNSKSAIAFAGGVGVAALTAIVTNVIRTAPSLQRTNHAGEQVSLSEGVGAATALIGSAVARRDFAAAAALAATANAGWQTLQPQCWNGRARTKTGCKIEPHGRQ